LNYIYLYY